MLLFSNENHTATLRSGIPGLAGEACTVYGAFGNICGKSTKYFGIKVHERKKSAKKRRFIWFENQEERWTIFYSRARAYNIGKEKINPPIPPICHPMYCQIGRIGGMFFSFTYI